ncbi:MAG: hypothetical protein AAFU50_05095, partial [Pseudomonadota bacterium]
MADQASTVSGGGSAAAEADERVRAISPFRKALMRPELGSICGTILVFVFFLMLAGDSGMFSPEG